jgi:quercetin dioxygenase-like cupin family protein
MYRVNAENMPGNDISRTFEGGAHGPSSVSFFLVHNQPGHGPKLHHHPYDETFIILEASSTSQRPRRISRTDHGLGISD